MYRGIQCADGVNEALGVLRGTPPELSQLSSSRCKPKFQSPGALLLGWPELYKVPVVSDAIGPILGLLRVTDCLGVFQCIHMGTSVGYV